MVSRALPLFQREYAYEPSEFEQEGTDCRLSPLAERYVPRIWAVGLFDDGISF